MEGFIGGVDIPYDCDTMVVGAGGCSRVVNYRAKLKSRDRLLLYKYADGGDVKALLAVVGMSTPVSFDRRVYYDDRGAGEYDNRPSPDIVAKTVAMLKRRLSMGVKALTLHKVDEYLLNRRTLVEMYRLTSFLATTLRRKHKSGAVKKIKIGCAISEMVDHVAEADLFVVVAVGGGERSLSTLSEVVMCLVGRLASLRLAEGVWPVDMGLPPRCFPVMGKTVAAAVEAARRLGDVDNPSVRLLVHTVLMTEHALLPHLVNVEGYYNDVARDVVRIHGFLERYLGGAGV